MHSRRQIIQALQALGDLLAFRGLSAEIAIIGGSALLLSGLSTRVTHDVDVVAVVAERRLLDPAELPSAVLDAATEVAVDLNLDPAWINTGPSDLLRFGLPSGFLERAERFNFGALKVHVADRFDQIHFKLYAAADQGPRSKHTSDLRLLDPSREDLRMAAEWAQTHDPSPGFAESVQAVISYLGFGGNDDER
jgi:hypothetical protein